MLFWTLFMVLVKLGEGQTSATGTTFDWRSYLSSIPPITRPTTPPLDKHLCLLNYPKNDYCQAWRILPLIVLTNKDTAPTYFQAIQQYLKTVTEYCGVNNYLMPFIPTDYNSECSKYQFGNLTGDGSKWIGQLTLEDVYLPDKDEAVFVYEDLLSTLYNCTLEYPLHQYNAGAIFVFNDFDCLTLNDSGTFFDSANTLLLNVSTTKYVTNIQFLGNYSEFEVGCMNVMFLFCSVFFKNQICALNFFSRPEDLVTSADEDHTCAREGPANPKNETALILEIVLPCVFGTIILAVVLIIVIGRRSRRKWFRFWWEHTAATPAAAGQRRLSTNDYFDGDILMKNKKKDQWEINPRDLKIEEGEPLGHGAFAVVYKGVLKESCPLLVSSALPLEGKVSNGFEVAVKRLPNHADDKARSEFLKELDFMKSLGYHNHIISLLGCVTGPIDPMIVVEYCYHGDLLNFLRRNKEHFVPDDGSSQSATDEKTLTVKDLLSFSWQTSDGMVYLSSHNFIHRDLAARNVLLTKNLVAKIGDFGLCREVDTALYSSHGGRLPIKWMAIESLKYYEYTTKSDVWSYGVLLFEIFSFGEGPYQAIQPADMIEHLEAGSRLPRPGCCPEEIYKIMEESWEAEPGKRPTFQELRDRIGSLLTERDTHYGYLNLERRLSSNIPAECPTTPAEMPV